MNGYLLRGALACCLLLSPSASSANCLAPSSYAKAKLVIDPGSAHVGEPVTLSWSVPDQRKEISSPAYLMVLLPEAVRLDGIGFFALAPGSPNPKGVSYGLGQMRVVVPLHTVFSKHSGQIAVLPYAAGEMAIHWAVVGVADCGEWRAAGADLPTVTLQPGAPRIAVRDEFGDTQPESVIRALKGEYELHVFGNSFQVVDTRSGALILSRQGTKPTFSPSGRFLIVRPPQSETFEVIDLVAQRVVGRYAANSLFWSHGDSFLYAEGSRFGFLEIVRALHGRRSDPYDIPPGTEGGFDWQATLKVDKKIETVPYGVAGLDLQSGGVQEGNFTLARDRFAFYLSIAQGIVTFTKLPYLPYDNGSGASRNITVFDLGLGSEPQTYTNDSDGEAKLRTAFAIPETVKSGWKVGDELWFTSTLHDTANQEQRQQNYDPLKEEIKEVKRLFNAAYKSTGTATAPSAGKKLAKAQRKTSRTRAAILLGRPLPSDRSPDRVIGVELSSLPYAKLSPLRGGRDAEALKKIEKEIAPLYSSNIAIFKPMPYDSGAFVNPVPLEWPEEPAKIDLLATGRDLWRWQIGSRSFWLTQTVQSGRNGYRFSFTMLAAEGGKAIGFADLIDAANKQYGRPANTHEGNTDEEGEGGLFDQTQLGDVRTELGAAFGDPSVVGVSGDRYLAIVTKPLPRIIVFDLIDWRAVCGIPEPIDGADAISLTVQADTKHIIQRDADGAVHVYACPSGEVVLHGAYVDDELVVMDNDGYFDGSDDAVGYIEVAVPGLPGRQLLSQFGKVLYRPGIAAEVLAGNGPGSPPEIRVPPLLRLASNSTAAGDVELEAYSDSGLDHVDVYANGRLLKRIPATGKSAKLLLPASDIADKAFVTAVAVDQSDFASAPLELTEREMTKNKTGQLFALAVGIDAYPALPGGNLRYAAADARRIIDAVNAASGYTNVAARPPLVDQSADERTILTELDRIVGLATDKDTILVSFAGHGLVDGVGQLRLGLTGTNPDNIETTSLSFDDVAARLRGSKARVIVLLDVCHAGLADRASIASNDAAATRLITDSGAPIIVLSASKGRQFSEETAEDGGGRFSVALARIIKSERKTYDTDADGALSLSELYRGVKSIVVRESGGRQTPWLTRNLMFGDFDLF